MVNVILKNNSKNRRKKEKPVQSSKEKFEIQFIANQKIEFDIRYLFFEERTFVSFYDNNLAFNDPQSIFQPPRG